MLMRDCVRNGGMVDFLSRLQDLENIHIRLYTHIPSAGKVLTIIVPLSKIFGNTVFSRLRELALDSLWLESGELCDLLSRQGNTLELLTLSNLNLGETTVAAEWISGVVRIAEVGFRVHAAGMVERHPEWLQVAEACQSLPKLRGLAIETPSVSVDWTVLPGWEVEELIEIGMDGRENALAVRSWRDIWE